jgi:hypothetical protein
LRATYPNVDEWWDAARIEPDKNFGDIEAPFSLEISENGGITTNNGTISWKGAPAGTILNTRTGLALKDDEIVNEKLEGNLTMKIPVGAVYAATGDNIISITSGKNLIYDRLYI